MTIRVLFLCTGNSARSQMAEHLLRAFGGDRFEVFSAGTDPTVIQPLTVQVLAEVHIDASRARSKSIDVFLDEQFDYIITVCDKARDRCPVFPGDARRIHWSFEDPVAAEGDAEHKLQVFRRIRTEMTNRLRIWIPAVTRAA